MQATSLSKKPKTAVVAPAIEPSINRLGPSVSLNVIVHNWHERGNNDLCSRFAYQLSQGPEVFFDHPWTTHCSLTAAQVEEQ